MGEGTGEARASARGGGWRHELFATVLLGLATVGSAWSAYQSARWASIEAVDFGEANAARSESVRASERASTFMEIDASLFVAWLAAYEEGEAHLARAYRERFRPEFRRAFEVWLSSAPPWAELPDGTPLTSGAYVLGKSAEAERLHERATGLFARGRRANDLSTNYVLPVVVFATVLFLSGTAVKLPRDSVRAGLLAMATVMFLFGVGLVIAVPLVT